MGSELYRRCLRPVLFTQDAEEAHERALRALGFAARHRWLETALAACFGAPVLPVEAFGLRFPNPVGLAAGMDKHAQAVPVWPALGFGFAELGAVTRHAQPGNPRPRVFRVVSQEAIVNRMGFNNEGAAAVAERLAQCRAQGRWPRHPVGINLGKSKLTPLAEAGQDYAASLRALWPHADFFVVNVSSPNTPDLRQLQDKAALAAVLGALQAVNQELAGASGTASAPARPKPILVKVAPDLSFSALDEIAELVEPYKLAGLVATNTTIARPETGDPRARRWYEETGGLSGRPLRARSTEVVRHLYRQTRGAVPIIGVGGIFDAADAWEKIGAGATLVQLYTGFVFGGPSTAREVAMGLRARLAAAGLADLRQAVGTAA